MPSPDACSRSEMLDAGLTKLDDANNAGGRNSEQCTLILTEGDSAKSLVIAGMSVAGRDNFGVFPLRQASAHNMLQRCRLGLCIWAGIAGKMQPLHLFRMLPFEDDSGIGLAGASC